MAERKTFSERLSNAVWVFLQNVLPSKPYLSMRYYVVFRRKLNWNNPRFFSEKLQWLKLYGCPPSYTKMVDKVTAKEYVAGLIGDQYIIPTLGVWDSEMNIDFEALPDRFVLKCNHNSGDVIICTDKSMLDVDATRNKVRQMLADNYYLRARETPYKKISRKVFAEKYIENNKSTSLNDYKIYCFDGQPMCVLVVQGRNTITYFDYFDLQWNHIDVCDKGEINAPVPPPPPVTLSEMLHIAEVLSSGLPHVRVDLYEVDGKVFFGELTFFDGGGFAVYNKDEWDLHMGTFLELPRNVEHA